MTNDKSYDLLVIGGGIFGLWVAKWAVEKGMTVALAEKDKVGAGASGGLLGALMPHIPTGWNEKKQFQFEALSELSYIIQCLEDETGARTGYRRLGRAMPLRQKRFVDIARQREEASRETWQQDSGTFDFRVCQDEAISDWLSKDRAAFGYVLDTLAARVNPRGYLEALRQWLSTRATILETHEFDRFNNSVASFGGGKTSLKAGQVVLALGYETFPHLVKTHDLDIGSGVKGQSAIFQIGNTDGLPVIYDDGVYTVPHDNGMCAVGSTSENSWTNPSEPDLANTEFIEKAVTLCPRLQGLEPVERWAGVRPKCHQREPIIGRLMEDDPIYIATGGFKVSFGIAHRVSEWLVDEIMGEPSRVALPSTFTVEHHLSAVREKRVSKKRDFH